MPVKLLYEVSKKGKVGYSLPNETIKQELLEHYLPKEWIREEIDLPEVSEPEIVRHFVNLSTMNYGVDTGFYPLGSCTMKYNPKINEVTAALPGFAELHPCSEERNAQGALQLMYELSELLMKITGLQGCTLQPAAGSHGEFAGINIIAAYHEDRKDIKRTKILIPDSAHGTNPASSAIGGFSIVSINSNADGLVDIDDLKSKCNDEVAGFMLTNPNTLGDRKSVV